MRSYYEIEQGTEEWHAIRYGKIGGTLSKGLFVKSDTLLIELLSEKAEEFELEFDPFISNDMQRGNDLEPIARKQLEQYTGIEFIKSGWLQCEENELLGISPDGISKCETISCEIKCPASKKHLSTILSNDIPNDNIHQCLHYFTVNPKLERHFFCSYRPENIFKPLFVKELNRESLINLGTNAKPVIKSVNEWVEIAKSEALKIYQELEEKIKQLSF